MMSSKRYYLFMVLVATIVLAASMFVAAAQHSTPVHGGAAHETEAATAASGPELAAQLYVDAGDAAVRQRAAVEYLAGDDCQGRRTGTPGADNAAAYLEAIFASLGVEPAPGTRGYRQGFSVTHGIQVKGTPVVSIGDYELVPDEDFAVAGFSGSGRVHNAPLAFAGYGIVAPELEWNDYEGIDVDGAVVAVVRGEPYEADDARSFAPTVPSVYSDLRRKASLARDLGAVAMIVLENPFSAPTDELPEVRPTYTAAGFNIPVVHIRRSVIEGLATAEIDTSFDCTAQVELMDSLSAPASLAFKDVRADMNIKVEKSLATGFNIVGVVPGADVELADEYVVVGAHYDHLGIGGPESSTPERYGEIHYGADDNASGVAVVLEVLYQAMEQREQLKRSLLFCLFSGEEMGIIGSTALMRQPPVPPDNMYAMLNVDMAGHLKDNTLIIGGLDSALELAELLETPALAAGLVLSEDRSGLGGSDHVSFLGAEIPSLFFCTGVFTGYHSPDDTPEGINYGGLGRVADMAVDTTFALANKPGELAFNPEFTQVPGPERSTGKLQVSMGTVPHYGGETPVPGMGVGDVTPGGPAELAGIIGGDVIVQIMDRRIASIYDFMFVLQDCEPGQTVPVKVWRDGEELEFEVTLAARSVDR